MNKMAKRRVAIVSEIPGTTRDLISTQMQMFGQQVTLTDTAGLRGETKDTIEKQGILMAQEEA
jgi:tRNA modification GTPase